MKIIFIVLILFWAIKLHSQNGIYKITNLNEKYESYEFLLFYNNEIYELKDDIKVNPIKSYIVYYNISNIKLKAEVYVNLELNIDNTSKTIDFSDETVFFNKSFLKNEIDSKELILKKDKIKYTKNTNNFQSSVYSLEYSSYFSDGTYDKLKAVTEDKKGFIYFGGESKINTFPFNKYIGNKQGGKSQLIIKTNKDMDIIWINLIGGSGDESIFDISVGKDNNLWGVGLVESNNYPLVGNSIQKSYYGAGDGSIFCLNENGQLVFSSYYGTGLYEYLTSVETKDEYIYVAGIAEGEVGYFMIFSKDGSILHKGIVDSPGAVEDIAIDSLGNLYLTGRINSNLKVNSKNKHIGENDSYVLKFNLESLKFENMVYIGGSSDEQSFNIELDSKGNLYLAGVTKSYNFPSIDFNDTFKGEQDVFLVKINSDFEIIWTRIIGGSSQDGIKNDGSNQGGLCVRDDYVYISSQTKSNNFELKNSIINDFKNGYDFFVQKYDLDGNLLFSTILNGNGDDYCREIYVDNYSSIYFAGVTTSTDFITTSNAMQQIPKDSYNKAIFGKLELSNRPIPDKPCETNFFDYTGFHNKEGLILTQDAVTYDSTLRLTRETFFEKGAVWVEYPIKITKGFGTEFSFELSKGNDYDYPDGSMPGADGITFIIQADEPDVIGNSGGGIGYEGLKNAFVVELDLFQNDEQGFSDPNGNHLGVFSSRDRISADHQSDDLVYQNIDIEEIHNDKTRYNFIARYDDEKRTFEVFLNEKGMSEKRVALLENFDFRDHIDLIDDGFAYLGISAATGNSVQRHELKSWSFCGGEKLLSINKNVDDIIYPNPVKDNVIVNEKFVMDEIQIFDLLGNRCDFLLSGNTLNLSQLNKGVYFIQVYQNNTTFTQKFIKE